MKRTILDAFDRWKDALLIKTSKQPRLHVTALTRASPAWKT